MVESSDEWSDLTIVLQLYCAPCGRIAQNTNTVTQILAEAGHQSDNTTPNKRKLYSCNVTLVATCRE